MLNPIDIKKLNKISKEKKSEYKNAFPFPHIIIDDFFDVDYLNTVLQEFPDLHSKKESIHHTGRTDEKLASPRGVGFQKEFTKNLMMFLNGSEFIDFLQELTGIKEKLIPDPHFIGGGLHQTYKDGFLKIHADFCKHPETNLDRRINLLVYLNKDWEPNYLGELHLFDKNMKESIKILPIFNRVVIFNTTDYTFHGVPEPLNCPLNTSRKSLALYYFSNGRPKNEVRSILDTNSTIYKEMEGEIFKSSMKSLLIKLIPPVFYPLIKKIKKNIS